MGAPCSNKSLSGRQNIFRQQKYTTFFAQMLNSVIEMADAHVRDASTRATHDAVRAGVITPGFASSLLAAIYFRLPPATCNILLNVLKKLPVALQLTHHRRDCWPASAFVCLFDQLVVPLSERDELTIAPWRLLSELDLARDPNAYRAMLFSGCPDVRDVVHDIGRAMQVTERGSGVLAALIRYQRAVHIFDGLLSGYIYASPPRVVSGLLSVDARVFLATRRANALLAVYAQISDSSRTATVAGRRARKRARTKPASENTSVPRDALMTSVAVVCLDSMPRECLVVIMSFCSDYELLVVLRSASRRSRDSAEVALRRRHGNCLARPGQRYPTWLDFRLSRLGFEVRCRRCRYIACYPAQGKLPCFACAHIEPPAPSALHPALFYAFVQLRPAVGALKALHWIAAGHDPEDTDAGQRIRARLGKWVATALAQPRIPSRSLVARAGTTLFLALPRLSATAFDMVLETKMHPSAVYALAVAAEKAAAGAPF